MSQPLPALTAPTASETSTLRFNGLWLFSPRADVSILLIPAAVTLFFLWMSGFVGTADEGTSRILGRWVAQFLLFNGTHVILTFLLLAMKRELLHTTPNQPKLMMLGSGTVFVVTLALGWYGKFHSPLVGTLLPAIIYIFAVHHTLSQVKGFWALYGLRGRSGGVPPMSSKERTLQKVFVPLALVLFLLRTMWMPEGTGSGEAWPLVDAGQGALGLLPFWFHWVLLAVWLGFVGLLASVLISTRQGGPKLLYLLGQSGFVTVTLLWPAWGALLSAGAHGLEYAILTGRMLEPGAGEAGAKPSRAWVWPLMLAVMAPMIVVGFASGPLVPLLDSATGGAASQGILGRQTMWTAAALVSGSIVLAHYFADAFLFRFRIPKVREVTLARLGLT